MTIDDFVQVTTEPRFVRLTFAVNGHTTLGNARGAEPFLLLTDQEIDDLIERLIDAKDREVYVGVEVSGKSGTWSYIDPTGELEIGDRVLVPFGYENREYLGKVVAYGRGSYGGGCKEVTALLDVTELSA